MDGKLLYENKLIDRLRRADEIIIYGAGVMGRAVKRCLEEAPYYMCIKRFLVESMKGNEEVVDGVSVMELANAQRYRGTLILVALHERHMAKAMEKLREEGFANLVPISFDSDVWSDIRGNWFRHRQMASGLPCAGLEEEVGGRLRIYVVHSVADKQVMGRPADKEFEIPIQAGAALTGQVIASVRDNQGRHISERNRKYCELTALYWIWKNDKSEYAGLCHYRRRFALDEGLAGKLADSGIDVVLTVPVVNFPNVKAQYCADHEPGDWEVMMEAIRLLWPEYMETAEEIQDGLYYYAYNMFIARKEILDRFCGWLFPVLFYCEQKIGDKEDCYQNRYIGFLGERLLTIFFVHHRGEYRMAIARKHFIGEEE